MNSTEKLLTMVNDLEKTFENYQTRALKSALLENLREETAKSTGKKSELSAVKKLFVKDTQERLKNGFSCCGNRYAFTDGHRAFISDTNLGFEKLANPINFNEYFTADIPHYEKITIDKSDVEYFKKVSKAEKSKKPYIFESENGTKCAVNPNFLLDAIKFSGSNVFYVDVKMSRLGTCNVNPYYQINENNEVVTMTLPVNIAC